jgi:L-fuconolactonase
MFVIDAHQHFWDVSRTDYGWLTPGLGAIYRTFEPADLQPLLAAAGVDRTVLVQAAQSEAETLYLLDIAAQTPFVAGVVGWVDMEAADASDRVSYMADKGVIGLRPMVQDIAETEWLLRPALSPATTTMIAHDLRFDALIQPRHLAVLPHFMKAYPELKVVIDHGAKPDIAHEGFQPWADGMQKIAEETSAYCKLSGLVTEAAANWQPDDFKPYMDHLLQCFGPERLIWGSDWPVLNLASDYAGWHAVVEAFLNELEPEARSKVMGRNAAKFYGI